MSTAAEIIERVRDGILAIEEELKRELNIMCEGYEGCTKVATWSWRCEGCTHVTLFCSPCKAKLEANLTKAVVHGVAVACQHCETVVTPPLRLLPL